jgi:chromosomal replication initiator protein
MAELTFVKQNACGQPDLRSIESLMRNNLAIPLPSRTCGMVALIQATVADSYGIARDRMKSAARDRPVAWPRQIAMYLARELTGFSLPSIGRMFNRDHTTVMYAIRQVEARIAYDPEQRADVRALREALEKPEAQL